MYIYILFAAIYTFPHVICNNALLKRYPEATISAFNKNACMTVEMFLIWLTKFIEFIHPDISGNVLLLLYSHFSHMTLDSKKWQKVTKLIC